MSVKGSPCKNCLDRTLTCHGVCRRYQDWKKEKAIENQWMKEKNEVVTLGWIRTYKERIRKHGRQLDKKTKRYIDD